MTCEISQAFFLHEMPAAFDGYMRLSLRPRDALNKRRITALSNRIIIGKCADERLLEPSKNSQASRCASSDGDAGSVGTWLGMARTAIVYFASGNGAS